MLNPKTDDDEKEGGKKNNDAQVQQKGLSPMRDQVNEIADEIIKVLVESIDKGGHGAISPLTMTISIGSDCRSILSSCKIESFSSWFTFIKGNYFVNVIDLYIIKIEWVVLANLYKSEQEI